MTPRQRALRVTLKWFCMGECESNDGLLCRWHADIERAIQDGIAEVLGGGNTMIYSNASNTPPFPGHPEPERDPNSGIALG